MKPKISVIITVYNLEKYVSKCIESVINQSYKNLEIIIVNDGSTDKSLDICRFYAKQDDRIIVVNQDNQGVSRTRNNALDIAAGEYIGFVDGDDWAACDMYQLLYDNICKSGAEISVCNFSYVNNKTKIKAISNSTNRYNFNTGGSAIVLEDYEKIKKFVYYDNNFLCNKLYKKTLFSSIRFPANKTYEDIFTVYKLVDRAAKIVISSEQKYYYLMRSESITNVPFTSGRLRMVEAYIERYMYLTAKYSECDEIEQICRKRIFTSLLECMMSAPQNNAIYSYKEDIEKVIARVKNYNMNDCALDADQEKMLKLLFDSIKKYVVAARVYSAASKNTIENHNNK